MRARTVSPKSNYRVWVGNASELVVFPGNRLTVIGTRETPIGEIYSVKFCNLKFDIPKRDVILIEEVEMESLYA